MHACINDMTENFEATEQDCKEARYFLRLLESEGKVRYIYRSELSSFKDTICCMHHKDRVQQENLFHHKRPPFSAGRLTLKDTLSVSRMPIPVSILLGPYASSYRYASVELALNRANHQQGR
jgi:hypothetical protein